MAWSEAQLSVARASMARTMLTDNCQHFAKTDTLTASGSEIQEYVSQGDLPCLIYVATQGSSQSEIGSVGESTADVLTHTFRLAWDAEVTVGDKLVANGSTFLVISDTDNDTNRFLLEVGAQRIRGNK